MSNRQRPPRRATPAARVLCIGLDAAEPTLLRRWAAAGQMPVLKGLMARGSVAILRPPVGFYVSAAWPSFATAGSPLRHGRFAGRQLVPGSYRVEELANAGIEQEPFWNALSAAGLRVAVVDVPKSVPADGLNGVQLTDWATHDPGQGTGFHCWPPELRESLLAGLPADRLGTCEVQRRGIRGFRRLTETLVCNVRRKGELSCRLLARGPWDLLISVLSEPHCIGHQAWHLHDPDHPLFDPRIAAAIGDPIARVYRAVDEELGRMLAAAGPEALIALMSSHGMGPNYSGDHLLRPMVASILRGRAAGSGAHDGLSLVWNLLPEALRGGLRPLQKGLRRRWQGGEARRGTCFQLPNNASYSALRANLAGREPSGVLADRSALDALYRRLLRELPRFVNVATGTPVVERLWRVEELWPGRRLDDTLPDFLVQWRMDAPVSAVGHPELGVLRGRYRGPRTGEHREQGLLVLAGPGAGTLPPSVDIEELGPLLCRHLGFEARDTVGA